MPIYMDFHELPDGVTAAHVAEMHQEDLKIEHHYNCRGLTYWCDERRKTAFCLMEAPNEQAVIDLHTKAHGEVPQRIIEVNETIVESFLGRIEDPEKSQNTTLNIINDPAFRTLMVVTFDKNGLRTEAIETLQAAIRGYHKSITAIVNSHQGSIVKQTANTYLMSFNSVTEAIESAIEIQDLRNAVITPDLEFKIGISAGTPITQSDTIFEDTIKKADYLSCVANQTTIVTPEVKDLYESENQNQPIILKGIRALNASEMDFVMRLFVYTETVWMHSNTKAIDYTMNLGFSKSNLYRTMMSIVGKSPNAFLKDFRLKKALQLLDKQEANISEIAYRTGFSTPAYFSKCFHEAYGMRPSKYSKQLLKR